MEIKKEKKAINNELKEISKQKKKREDPLIIIFKNEIIRYQAYFM